MTSLSSEGLIARRGTSTHSSWTDGELPKRCPKSATESSMGTVNLEDDMFRNGEIHLW